MATDSGFPGERRSAPRRRVLLAGKLVFGEAQMTLECTIGDLSAQGARLRLASAEPLTDPIWLIDLTNGLCYRSRQIWRQEGKVGLAFSDYHDLRTASAELPPILRRLWVEQQGR
jgi:hypothetical protein